MTAAPWHLPPTLVTAPQGQRERVKALEKRLGHVRAIGGGISTGAPEMLKHDFRRTAIRNLERADVSRSVATKITGHRTEASYRRHAIVSDPDRREAAATFAGTGLPLLCASRAS